MTNELKIPVILGTDREGRRSEAPANFVLEQVKKRGIKTQLVDPRDYPVDARILNNELQDSVKPWQKIAQNADGFVIVSPEYNHGYPGALKSLLDALYEEFHYKPVAICGVSSGMLGGARMVEQLRLVAIEFKMLPIREAVYFSNAKDLKLDEFVPRVNKMLDELIWLAESLKPARQARSQK